MIDEINVYVENGYESREHYMECLSEDYGVPLDHLWCLAEVLGEEEDFDGLVAAIESF